MGMRSVLSFITGIPKYHSLKTNQDGEHRRTTFSPHPFSFVLAIGATLSWTNAAHAASQPSGPAPLSKLIENCGAIAASHGMCDDDIYKPVWRRFESSIGEVVKVDTRRIEPMSGGGAIAWTYRYVPGTHFDATRLIRYYFTCSGQFRPLERQGVLMDAPPRSLFGEIAANVCFAAEIPRRAIAAQNARVEAIQRDRALHPRPSDYCEGFSADACERIKAGVEARMAPPYCRPGFASPERGLDHEQLRTCWARPAP
jgi:hypothetical protein